MATSISLASGSVLNGNPIVFNVQPRRIYGTPPSFHRVILDVACGISGGNMEIISLSKPVLAENGASVQIDVSSALRSFRDAYTYTATPTASYPLVKFNVKAHDEYMYDGELKTTDELWYPAEDQYMNTLFGSFSDRERLTAEGTTLPVTRLSRKPQSLPQLVCVGDRFVYSASYAEGQLLPQSAGLVAPTPTYVDITKEVLQTVGDQQLYALPATEAQNRATFRFVNSFGVVESVSVPRVSGKTFTHKATDYIKAMPETFNVFSRATVRKISDKEVWRFSTDPLNEEWLSWYLHEFLMSNHVWLLCDSLFVPCRLSIDDEYEMKNDTQEKYYAVEFTVKMDIDGSPLY